MYADLSLEHKALKDISSKKNIKPAERKALAHYPNEVHGLSIRQACRAVKISRAAFYFRAKLSDDEKIAAKLRLLSEAKPAGDSEKCFPGYGGKDIPGTISGCTEFIAT